jgi:Sulfotransferase domain
MSDGGSARRPALEELLRTRVKGSLRTYGRLTAGRRPLPDFLIVGAKRGGTTSLYNYLLEHPQVAPLFPRRQQIKGVRFFDLNFHRGLGWYRSHFPTAARPRPRQARTTRRVIAGEASPYYLFHPLAAERASQAVPEARIIVLLRDPVERAYSHYKERVRHGAEPCRSFEEAIDREPERLRGETERILADPTYHSFAHEHYSYLSQGRYLDMLPRWLERFPHEQLLIMPSEELYADPQATLDRVLAFLGLPAWELRDRRPYNFHPADGMAATTRQRLAAGYVEHNRQLAELLGTRLDWS